MKQNFSKKLSAFTLIDLLIAMVIVSILVAATMPIVMLLGS